MNTYKDLDMPWEDYEGYDYSKYWNSKVRDYEDLIEHKILKRLLPVGADSIVDLGANYGRLANEFVGFSTIFLIDGSLSAAIQACNFLQGISFHYIVSDIRCTPLLHQTFDVVTCIRTFHHQVNIELIFAEARRLLRPGGYFIFNYANKKNAWIQL
jgi:ubiquinone/menaquinone biosynthesis C-methylase UbiE